jgi:hypothetical protein
MGCWCVAASQELGQQRSLVNSPSNVSEVKDTKG